MGSDLGLYLVNLVNKRSTEPSLVFYLMLVGALFLIALGLIELFARWEEGRVEPFRALERGMTAQEVKNRVGEAKLVFFSGNELGSELEGWNLLCREFGKILPDGLGTGDRSQCYFDGTEVKLKPLPPITGRAGLYRPAIMHRIIVYFDEKSLVSLILKCTP